VEDSRNLQNELYCNWRYVTCNNGRIQKIEINSASLSGAISPSIGGLTYLEVLNLLDNQIGGEIPDTIGSLRNLRQCTLAHNRIGGTIPNSMMNNTNLELFHLHGNRLTGTVPDKIQVNRTRYHSSSFTADCGFPSLSTPLICTKCTMCCNSNDECTPKKKKLYISFYATAILGIVPFFLPFLSKLGFFLGPNEEATVEDVLRNIGLNSVYIFGLSDKRNYNLLALAVLALQTTVFVLFLLASPFNPVLKSDWRYQWECPINNLVCEQNGSEKYISFGLAMLIILIFIARDIFGGSWTILFSNKLQHGVRKSRIFIVGSVLTIISLFSLLVSVVYIWATTTKTTEVITSSVIILFINMLDEEVFSLIESLYPNSVRDEIDLIKILYTDVLESNHLEREEVNEAVEIEMEEEG